MNSELLSFVWLSAIFANEYLHYMSGFHLLTVNMPMSALSKCPHPQTLTGALHQERSRKQIGHDQEQLEEHR